MSLKTLTAATFVASLAFAPLAHADITIGLIAPLTGPVAAYGEQVKNGAQTAVDEINKSGGVLGQKLVLKFGDDAGDPKQGVSVANGFVGDNIRFVVGPVTSGVAIPVSDALAENGILMVTPTATAPDLTNRGLTNILRTCGRDDQQATVAANYVVKNLKDKKIAILDDKGAYGKGVHDWAPESECREETLGCINKSKVEFGGARKSTPKRRAPWANCCRGLASRHPLARPSPAH